MDEPGYVGLDIPSLKEKEKKKDPKDGKTTKIIAATGLFTLGLTLAKEWNTLPSWVRYVAVVILGLLVIYLFDIHYRFRVDKLRLRSRIREWRQNRIEDRVARKNFNGFRKVVNDFINVLGSRLILAALRDLPKKAKEFSNLCIPNDNYCFNIVKSFRTNLIHFTIKRKATINRDTLSQFSKFFSDLVYYYVEYYIEEPSREVVEVGKEYIPADLEETLKKSIEKEKAGLVEEEVLPAETTARLEELQVSLHRAESEYARAKIDYDRLLAEWRHGPPKE